MVAVAVVRGPLGGAEDRVQGSVSRDNAGRAIECDGDGAQVLAAAYLVTPCAWGSCYLLDLALIASTAPDAEGRGGGSAAMRFTGKCDGTRESARYGERGRGGESEASAGSDGHGKGAHIRLAGWQRVLEGVNCRCLHHCKKRGGGKGGGRGGRARDDEGRNKGSSIHVGGYLDVNRQPSVAVDRLFYEALLYYSLPAADWRRRRRRRRSAPPPPSRSTGTPPKSEAARPGRVESASDLARRPHPRLACGWRG